METLAISWPAAVAVVASVIAITFGAIRIMAQGKDTISVNSLKKDHQALNDRVRGVETSMARLESDLSGVITTQIKDLKGDITRLDAKIDTMVKEVINALASLKNKD